MSFKGYSDLWNVAESIMSSDCHNNRKTKEDEEAVVYENEFCENYVGRLGKDQIALRKLLCSEAVMKIEDNEINPVLGVFKKVNADAEKIAYLQDTFETFNKGNSANIPIVLLHNSYVGIQSFSFRTKRNNEIVQVDFLLKKFQFRFYDKTDERSDEYCLEMYVNKKLANPGKLQQEFSVFLSSGKHLIEFIFDTLWPYIDESVKKEEHTFQQKNKKLRRNNQETTQRENHSRYFLRSQKNEPSTAC